MEIEVKFDEYEFTEEDDEKWEAFLSFMREHERKREREGKTLIINLKKLQLLKDLLQKLKYLLAENGFDYKLKINRVQCFDTVLHITIILESFGVAPKDYKIFKDIINSIDSFSITALADGNIDITMCINNMFIKLK